MKISQIMSDQFAYIGQGESLERAAALMRDHDIGMLPVLEEHQVVGTVTDRDMVVRGLAAGLDPKTPVSGIMSRGVQSIHADADVAEAARAMESAQVRRLVVLDRDERCIGVLSTGDIATGVAEPRLAGEVLAGISAPVS
ncbi:CBS domain-containing protein [uncultured Thiohalocapsa sp.]|uniref:CBS domain-containing protein n=1 Tax=uncultured Thiohalocapsa sp. TaxID=768990 RepID=UPI0025ED1083|nr:CBS domain-containing protein [uncultured Thiohalocapsa sp.]